MRGTDRCSSPSGNKGFSQGRPLFLGVHANEEMNMGLRDEVLLLSLEFHMVRMLFFMSIKSASVALKSSNESRWRAS